MGSNDFTAPASVTTGAATPNPIKLGKGNDNLFDTDQAATITGGNGNNVIDATGASDFISLRDGNITPYLTGATDDVGFGNANNLVDPSGAGTSISGGTGADKIYLTGANSFVTTLGYRLYWHQPPVFDPSNFRGDSENIFGNIMSINMLCVPAGWTQKVKDFRAVTGPADWIS